MKKYLPLVFVFACAKQQAPVATPTTTVTLEAKPDSIVLAISQDNCVELDAQPDSKELVGLQCLVTGPHMSTAEIFVVMDRGDWVKYGKSTVYETPKRGH